MPDAVTPVTELIAAPADGKPRNGVPVRLRGVCTYPNSRGFHFYMHDGKAGIIVGLKDAELCPKYGDEIEVTGKARGSSAGDAVVDAETVRVIGGRRPMPEPAKVLHYTAEGKIEFRALLFIPSHRPMSLEWGDHKGGLRLYIQRVLIM